MIIEASEFFLWISIIYIYVNTKKNTEKDTRNSRAKKEKRRKSEENLMDEFKLFSHSF